MTLQRQINTTASTDNFDDVHGAFPSSGRGEVDLSKASLANRGTQDPLRLVVAAQHLSGRERGRHLPWASLLSCHSRLLGGRCRLASGCRFGSGTFWRHLYRVPINAHLSLKLAAERETTPILGKGSLFVFDRELAIRDACWEQR